MISPIVRLVHQLLFFTLLSIISSAYAQENESRATVKELMEATEKEAAFVKSNKISKDPLGRDTPLSTLHNFGKALTDRDFKLAVEYMDMRNLPSSMQGKGQEIAREIRIISDKNIWIDPDTVSDKPEGHSNDGQPPYRDLLTRVDTPEGKIDILFQRVPDGKGNYIWKISNHTIAEIPKLYKYYGYGKLGDSLSRLFPEVAIASLLLWQWLLLLIIIILAFFIAWLTTYFLTFALKNNLLLRYPRLDRLLSGPVRFLIMVILIRDNFSLISPTIEARAVIASNTFLILAISWIFMGMIEMSLGRLSDRMKRSGNVQVSFILKPLVKLGKFLVFFVALLMWMDNLGFNVSTLLAGLGVGGIAVGLAAKKSIENFIGAIIIYTAQPIKVGDFCRIDGTLGVVEEIGLRATTLRTLERTLVTIPNATLTNVDIENLSNRDKILYRHKIQLAIESTPKQLRGILSRVKELLLSRPDVDPDPARIRFLEYGEHSLNFEVYAYITTRDFNEFLAISEQLNLQILDIITEEGTRLAVPVRAVAMVTNEPAQPKLA